MIPPTKILDCLRERLPWLPALALFFLALYEGSHLQLWIEAPAALGALLLGRWGFGFLLRLYRDWKQAQEFPARRLALLSLFVLALAYFLEFSETLPGSSLLFVFLVLWIFWCLWQRMSGALLATSLGVLGMALLLGILRIAVLAGTLLLFGQNRYEAYQAQQERNRLRLHWEKKENGTKADYMLFRGDAKRALFSIRADSSWFLDSKIGNGSSPDYPSPGLYIGALSQSITDPWAAPSLSFYRIDNAAHKSSFAKTKPLDLEKLISSLFAKSYALLKERERQGTLRKLHFLGKVKLVLQKSTAWAEKKGEHSEHSLKGIAFSFYDLSVEKKLRLGLYPLPLADISEAVLLMTIEEPQIGFPMDPRLLALLENLRVQKKAH